jgi:hypothetical protein
MISYTVNGFQVTCIESDGERRLWGVFTQTCHLVRFPVDKSELGHPPTTTG